MKKFRFSDMTKPEQKAIFFIFFVIVLGLLLNIFGYTSPSLREKQAIRPNTIGLNELLAKDFQIKYDLNKVTYEELLYFRGIGPSVAQSIIDYQLNTGFQAVEDLLNIRGVGVRRLSDFREYFFIDKDTLQIEKTQVTENDFEGDQNNYTIQRQTQSGKININMATYEDLILLRGIGQKRASSIIEYREQNGKFVNIEEIKNVKGIGNQIYDNIKNFISVGD